MKRRYLLVIFIFLALNFGFSSIPSEHFYLIDSGPFESGATLAAYSEYAYCGATYVDPILTPRTDYGTHENLGGGGMHQSTGYTRITEYQILMNDYLDLTYFIDVPSGYAEYELQIYVQDIQYGENLEVYVNVELEVPLGDLLLTISSTGLHTFDGLMAGDVYIILNDAVDSTLLQTIWDISYIRMYCYGHDPVIESVSCDSIYDGDNLYSYRGTGSNIYADFCVTLYDEEGYGEVQDAEIDFYDSNGNLQWGMYWSKDTGFDDSGNDYAHLDASSYTQSNGLYRLEVHFLVIIEWDHPEKDNCELDAYTDARRIRYSNALVGIDIRTGLHFYTAPTIAETRCDSGATVRCTGRVTYTDSESNLAPVSDGIDIVAVRTSPSSWTGQIVGVDSTGNFDVGCLTTGTAPKVNSFTIYVYEEGTSISLLSGTDSVQVDAVEVVPGSAGVSDLLVNVGSDTADIYCNLRYVSGTEIVKGGIVSAVWSGVTLQWNDTYSRWQGKSMSLASPGETEYDNLVILTTQGVTDVRTHPSVTLTHDRVKITWMAISDDLINPGQNTEIRVRMEFEFYSHTLGIGDTVTVTDGTQSFVLTWDNTNLWFDGLVTSSIDGIMTYSVKSVSCWNGITTFNSNGLSVDATYEIVTITGAGTIDPDSWVNVHESHTFWFTAELLYSGTVLGFEDSIETNYGNADWSITNNRFEITVIRDSVTSIQVIVVAVLQASEVIITLESDPLTAIGIWTTISIELSVNDSRANLFDTVRVWANVSRDYDQSKVMNGTILLQLPSGATVSMTYSTSAGMWYADVYEGTVIRRFFQVYSVLDSIYALTSIGANPGVYCIWDSVVISISGPTPQIMLVGENASGIHVSAYYLFNGERYDGVVTLNDTVFVQYSEGKRGYCAESVSGDSFDITSISVNDETFAIWLDGYPSLVHIEVPIKSSLVSTQYDPRGLSVSVWLTDSVGTRIPGSVNITIGGSNYTVFCSETEKGSILFYSERSGDYSVKADFAGDAYYAESYATMTGITILPREISLESSIPQKMTAGTDTAFSFTHMYDATFSGIFQGVTYIHNYPVDANLSIWWTLSPDYNGPTHFVGSWVISRGMGEAVWQLPWDLDGDLKLTDMDFRCYLILVIDGLGVYEDRQYKRPVNVQHQIQLDLQVSGLIYSDTAAITLLAQPCYDTAYEENLDLDLNLYMSVDNTTWILLEYLSTDSNGWLATSWYCDITGSVFFRVMTEESDYYAACTTYSHFTSDKEDTVLSIVRASNFTYSDQAVLVARFTTDDGEPVAFYSTFLEILDGTWVSIGSGITNETGHVSLLWSPTLPAGNYTIRLLGLVTESQYYRAPQSVTTQLLINKELLVIEIDTSFVEQGLVRVRVRDDENTPVDGIPVTLYVGRDGAYLVTDEEGNADFELAIENGMWVQVVVEESDYYEGAEKEVQLLLPLDVMTLTIGVGGVFVAALVLAVGRKIRSGRVKPAAPPPISHELSEELRRERESVPERIEEHKERRREDIEEISRDGEDTE